MESTTLTIPAMQNEAIALAVARAIESVPGVGSVHIALAHTKARIGFDQDQTTRGDLRAAVERAGFVVDDTAVRQGCCGGCGG